MIKAIVPQKKMKKEREKATTTGNTKSETCQLQEENQIFLNLRQNNAQDDCYSVSIPKKKD